ncbi:glycosyltransferase [Peptoanaerobacter stomatis]
MSALEETDKIKNRLKDIFYKLFDLMEYDNALNALNQYSRLDKLEEKEIDFVSGAFINPNLEEIEDNFNYNLKLLDLNCSFDELRYNIIPTEKEEKFYILDKLDNRIISINEDIDVFANPNDKFSDFSMIIENKNIVIDNPFYISNFLKTKKRNFYVVIDKEIEIFLQIKKYTQEDISNIKIFRDVLQFEKYFINNDDYFPRNIIFYGDEPINRLLEVKERIHEYRIKNKKTEKRPLLTIGIPSCERGTFALSNITHVLKSEFDYEIEVVLSDNASTTLREYYDTIANIQDSRLVYNRNDRNLGFFGNVKKIIGISSAKYVLFNCDTDSLEIEQLDILLSKIKDSQVDYSQIITGYAIKGNDDREGYIDKPFDCTKFSFLSNSLFGLVLNIDIINNSKILEYMSNNYDANEYIIYYPQMVMDLFLISLGNMFLMKETLIKAYVGETPYLVSNEEFIYLDIDEFEDFENFYEKFKITDTSEKDMDKINFHGYSIGIAKKKKILRCYSIAGRTMQHIGGFNVIVDIFYKKNLIEEYIYIYQHFLLKTFFLIELNVKVNYLGFDSMKNIINKVEKAVFYINNINEDFFRLVSDKDFYVEELREFVKYHTDNFLKSINKLLKNAQN